MPKWNGIEMQEQPGMMQPGRLQLANPLITGPPYDHCPPYGHPRNLIIWAPIMPIIWTDGTGGGGAAGMPRGITDGSEAAPGQVGELLTSTNDQGKPTMMRAVVPPYYAPNAPWDVITQLMLTPGDWDVSSMAAFDPPANVTLTATYYSHAALTDDINVLPNWPFGWIYEVVEGFRANSFTLPIERRNVTVNTTIYLITTFEDITGTEVGKEGMGYGYIYARRVR